MSELSEHERQLGRLAAEVVRDAGGSVTFDQYDGLMAKQRYFAPLNWIDGWGDSVVHRKNNDKLCAFAACQMGLLMQTDGGYVMGVP